MKAPSPLLGFNNNVKHKGRVFHIQTEDSGVKHPHVITHLFVDGGRILKSTKTSYAEFLEQEDLSQRVRQLMQEQHKAMFIALRAGKFDHMMEGGDAAGPPSGAEARAPAPPSRPGATAAPPAEAPAAATASVRPAAPAIAAAPPEVAPLSSPARPASAPPPPADPPTSTRSPADASSLRRAASQPPSSGNASPVSLRPPSLVPPPPRASSPSFTSERLGAVDRGSFTNERGPSSERPAPRTDPRAETIATEAARPRLHSPLDLNLEAIERSSADPRPSVAPEPDLRDLPPPPAAVLGKKPVSINTSYRSIQHADPRAEPGGAEERGRTPAPTSVRPPSLTPPSRPRTAPMGIPPQRPPTRSPAAPPRSLTPQGARYAPSRPASIFGNARPQEGTSIFGEDLISEKSLDEVILSYLAEDLEGSKPKR